MRIDKISVENFRLFEKQDFSFHPQFNLIVGVNGSGKSSLLRALAICLNKIVTDFLGVNQKNPDLVVKQAAYILSSEDCHESIIEGEEVRYQKAEATQIKSKVVWDYGKGEKNYSIFLKSDEVKVLPKSRLFPLIYSVAAESGFFPLLVLYDCGRFWIPKKDSDRLVRSIQEKYSRQDGYTEWSKPQYDDTFLMLWIQKLDLIAYQEKKESLGWRVLNNALKNCFEGFEKLSFMAKEGDLVIHFTDGRRQLFKHMSDGQRCMIGLIGDMVRRAVLLNPQLGDEILEKTAGVVLIDELDLHLHPTWQRRIINDLRKTFPKVQFICTTHSPQLIGQAKPEEVIVLDGNFSHHPAQSYGMDSNWVLRHVMGGEDRDPVIAAKLDSVFEDIENASFDEAQIKIDALRQEIGEHPELVEADVLLHRYTHLDVDNEE